MKGYVSKKGQNLIINELGAAEGSMYKINLELIKVLQKSDFEVTDLKLDRVDQKNGLTLYFPGCSKDIMSVLCQQKNIDTQKLCEDELYYDGCRAMFDIEIQRLENIIETNRDHMNWTKETTKCLIGCKYMLKKLYEEMAYIHIDNWRKEQSRGSKFKEFISRFGAKSV